MSSYMFWGIYKQHVNSFNYGKIQTTGAVLVAISIPIFTSQLEKSREAVDLANIRSAYAECSAEALTADTATTYAVQKAVDIKQTTSGWASDFDEVCGVKKASVPQVKTTEKIYVTAMVKLRHSQKLLMALRRHLVVLLRQLKLFSNL